MKYYCPNRNPHFTHFQVVAKPRICEYCRQKIIFWKCSCGASVHFDPINEGKYGDHRLSCPETYGKNPYKKDIIRQIQRAPIKEWNYEKEFIDILEEYKMFFNSSLPIYDLTNYYYCGNCATIRPIDSTMIHRNNKKYIWCQCGKQKLLTIPFFGDKQKDFVKKKVKHCKNIILNFNDQYYDNIPPLIYFGSQIALFLDQEDLITFMYINYVYQRNFEKIKTPPENKYQTFLREMIGLEI